MKKTVTWILALSMIAAMLGGCSSSSSETTTSAETEAATSAEENETTEAVSGEETSEAEDTSGISDVEWPTSSSVEIYVPFSAGGNSDLTARVFAEALTNETGTNFVVVNQTEGGGAVCYNTVANAEADGSLLGFVTPSWFTTYLSGTHDLNPVDDFSTYAVTSALTSQYLIVPKDSEFDSLQDLIDYCTENPGSLTFGMQLGSASHYYAESCAQSIGVTWNYVEAGSDADRITSIMGNIIEATTINASTAAEYVEAGEVKCLAALYDVGEYATGALADVPSLSDLGYEDISVQNCNFLFGPVTDEALAQKINEVFTKVFESEDVQNQLAELNQAQELSVSSYAEIQDLMPTLYESYHSVAETLDILADGR